jgi:integrase
MIFYAMFKNWILNLNSRSLGELRRMEPNHWLEDWLSSRAESPKTRENYLYCWKNISTFCMNRGKDPSTLVEDWRAVKCQGEIPRERFLEEWMDLIRAFNTWLKPKYASLTMHNHLAVLRSFLVYWKIPLDVELPRHTYVKYHNRDLSKETIRQILSKATQRDRTIWLLMAESGLRANTAITLRYYQIQEDFEKDIIPLRILTPAEILKDHVGERWSFIGEDGARALREYLKPRMPLKGEDYVFASERPGMLKGEQFSVASLSVKFARLVRKLKLERGAPIGKPGHYRMHGLRKYFRNNMRADPSYREFWMGHSLGVDAHYVSRDPEFHRAECKKNYESLRILEPTTPTGFKEIQEQLKQKDTEIQQLRTEVQEMRKTQDTLIHLCKLIEKVGKDDGSKAQV